MLYTSLLSITMWYSCSFRAVPHHSRLKKKKKSLYVFDWNRIPNESNLLKCWDKIVFDDNAIFMIFFRPSLIRHRIRRWNFLFRFSLKSLDFRLRTCYLNFFKLYFLFKCELVETAPSVSSRSIICIHVCLQCVYICRRKKRDHP